jgi:predicted Zn-dependent protease
MEFTVELCRSNGRIITRDFEIDSPEEAVRVAKLVLADTQTLKRDNAMTARLYRGDEVLWFINSSGSEVVLC